MKHIGDKIVMMIISIFGRHIGKIIGIFFISMLPIIELRGSIPVGYAIGLPWYTTLFISIIGNMLPVWFILLFIVRIFEFMKKRNILTKLIEKIENRTGNIANKEFLGLLIFVAIPLPGTGAWTGALISALLKMDIKKSFIAILLGVLVASFLVTLGVYGLVDKIIL